MGAVWASDSVNEENTIAEADIIHNKAESKAAAPLLKGDTSTYTEIEVDMSLEEQKFDKETITLEDNLKALGAAEIESVFARGVKLVKPPGFGRRYCPAENGFITAIRTAYASHVPLMLAPDHFWTLISQGISKHIENNAEKFRDKFVNFDGKQTLKVARDTFVKGKQNDWAGCFTEFSAQIETYVGKEMKDRLCPTFSTTDQIARACHELGLMDCLKSYFDYRVTTDCGISKVKLQGSVDDWKKLIESLDILDELELSDWKAVLLPILDNLRRAVAGEETDEFFWTTIYKAHFGGGSGSHPTVDGWCTNFILHINGEKRDEFRPLKTLYAAITEQKKSRWSFRNPGVPQTAVPVGLSKTPFVWQYFGKEIKMNFYGGFVGAKFEDGYVSPVLGWAVGEQSDE